MIEPLDLVGIPHAGYKLSIQFIELAVQWIKGGGHRERGDHSAHDAPHVFLDDVHKKLLANLPGFDHLPRYLPVLALVGSWGLVGSGGALAGSRAITARITKE